MKKVISKNAQIYLENILRYSPGSLYWKDLNGIYLGCNQMQAEMAGFKSPEEMIGKTDYDMSWKDIADTLRATDKRIIETGKPEELIETATLVDGSKISVLTNKAPLYNEEGKIIGIIGTSLDITARIEAEERERKLLSIIAENYKIYLDNIVKNVPGSVYWKDKEGKYLGCNQMQANMAGLNFPQEMFGKTDYQMPWSDVADTITTTDSRIMENNTPEELIESGTLADGKIVTLLTNKAPLYDAENNIIGIIGTSLDITARVEAEEREKQALVSAATAEAERKAEEEIRRAIMVLAGSMAHDLRTPLFSLNLINHQLKKNVSEISRPDLSQQNKDEIGQKLSELTDKINNTIQKMHQFINHNLKALKHSTSNSLEQEALVECKSYNGIKDALDSYPFKPEERDLVKFDSSYYFTFSGNPIFFSRILFNLLNNSLYQIQKNGKGEIFISSEEQAEFNLIRFKDTAGGASPEIVNHIFDGYKTTKESGTGIGLAFCKITMENFGGDITCHAVEGDFIEFTLKFPKISQSSH